ncbi:MAG TPA: ABC transporter substrate-binding protein [Thermodesulfobacteriota bacterium]|nr:ABC transporter substrate-binding protein [Thermodesulfobacteriota bacterium]
MEKKLSKKISRRVFLKGAATGMALFGPGVPFITRRAVAQGTIRYGTMHPLTGTYSALGLDQQHATEMAVEEWNAKGGVLGNKIVWIHRDDQLNGAVALRRAKELAEEEKCDFIGGTLSGAISLAMNEFACKNKVIYVCYCQSDMVLGADQCKYGFAFMVIPYSAALAVSKYAFEKLGKKWFSITADYRWGHSLLEGWIWQSEQMGGNFLGNVYAPLGATDFSTYFAKIMAANPDFIVMNNLGSDQTAAIKQANELGLTKKMKIVCTKTAMATMKEVGPAYDENIVGGMTFYWKLRDKYATSKKFSDTFLKKYGKPIEQDGESGYVATNILFMAMQKAGTVTDKQKIIAAMEGLKYELTKGSEYVRACDHQRVQSYLLLRGKGKKAKDWDLADIIAEIPEDSIIMSCEDNAKKLPFINIKLPK